MNTIMGREPVIFCFRSHRQGSAERRCHFEKLKSLQKKWY